MRYLTMRHLWRVVLGLLALLVVPAVGHAQGLGAIAGVVRDTSGAVLPGVTVEAASPALIEQVRTAFTDGAGQYSIINLPPGTYSVTFTLTGFGTVRRGGIELLANFTAPVNAELSVGALQETVTVTGETPMVDIQSARTVRAVTADMIRAVPNGGTMYQLAQLTVGVVYTGTQDVGGASGSPVGSQVLAHGGRAGDEQQQLDGLRIGNFASQSGRSQQSLSPLLYEQVDIQLSGQGADVGTNGVITNAIPRSGGNTFSGIFLVNGSGDALQSSNLTADLEERGLSAGDSKLGLRRLFDLNGSFGGPLIRDRLWFYVTGRFQTNENYIAGTFFPVDPTAWERVEDRTRQASDPQYLRDSTSRLTWLISPNMRVSGTAAIQRKWWTYWALNASVSPEAAGRVTWPGRIFSGVWTYTPSNQVLFEAGLNRQRSGGRITPRPGEDFGRRIVEQGGVVFNGQPIAPITYGSYGGEAGFINDDGQAIYNSRASMSYVTGSHNFKIGMDNSWGSGRKNGVNYIDDIRFRTRGFNLNQVTIYAPLGRFKTFLDYNLGIYAQDRWTLGRLSLSGGLRFEFQKESNDAYAAGPTKYLPTRNLAFPAADVVNTWKEVSPRAGVSYDLFGNGRTALKMAAVRSVEQEGLNTAFDLNPANSLSTNTAINVIDANRNRVPDCDLFDPLPNGECQGWLNANFGSPRPQTQWDPRALNGWGVRPWNWEFSGGIQHELMPRLSVGLMYYRRIYGGFLVEENPETTAADYTAFTVTVPTDSRLPTSGQQLTIVDVNPVLANGQRFNTVTDRTTFASDFGTQREHWNGVDITGDWRFPGGGLMQGGVAFGRRQVDECEIVAALPETLGNTPTEFCSRTSGWEPSYKAVTSYTLPWQDVRVSGFFISTPGPDTVANVIYSGASLVPSLGRPLSGGGNRTVGVISPDTIYGDRRNQVDLRFSKIFRIGGGRTLDANVDLYNAFNSDAVTAESATFGATWRRPTQVLQGRIVKFGIWIEF